MISSFYPYIIFGLAIFSVVLIYVIFFMKDDVKEQEKENETVSYNPNNIGNRKRAETGLEKFRKKIPQAKKLNESDDNAVNALNAVMNVVRKNYDNAEFKIRDNEVALTEKEYEILYNGFQDTGFAWLAPIALAITDDGKLRIPFSSIQMIIQNFNPVMQEDGTMKIINFLSLDEAVTLSLMKGTPMFVRDKDNTIRTFTKEMLGERVIDRDIDEILNSADVLHAMEEKLEQKNQEILDRKKLFDEETIKTHQTIKAIMDKFKKSDEENKQVLEDLKKENSKLKKENSSLTNENQKANAELEKANAEISKHSTSDNEATQEARKNNILQSENTNRSTKNTVESTQNENPQVSAHNAITTEQHENSHIKKNENQPHVNEKKCNMRMFIDNIEEQVILNKGLKEMGFLVCANEYDLANDKKLIIFNLEKLKKYFELWKQGKICAFEFNFHEKEFYMWDKYSSEALRIVGVAIFSTNFDIETTTQQSIIGCKSSKIKENGFELSILRNFIEKKQIKEFEA